jgi:hypothetical protein
VPMRNFGAGTLVMCGKLWWCSKYYFTSLRNLCKIFGLHPNMVTPEGRGLEHQDAHKLGMVVRWYKRGAERRGMGTGERWGKGR